MASERLNYIDVAKGLLILCVVFGHIYGHSKSIDNITVDYFHRISNLYISFYMPCFFLITGYCSNFNKKLNTLFTSSFKTIAFPGIIFSIFFFLLERKYDVASFCHLIKGISFYGGSYWFLSALFVARILYGLIYKCLRVKDPSFSQSGMVALFPGSRLLGRFVLTAERGDSDLFRVRDPERQFISMDLKLHGIPQGCQLHHGHLGAGNNPHVQKVLPERSGPSDGFDPGGFPGFQFSQVHLRCFRPVC